MSFSAATHEMHKPQGSHNRDISFSRLLGLVFYTFEKRQGCIPESENVIHINIEGFREIHFPLQQGHFCCDTNTKTKTIQIQRTYKYKYKRNTFQLKVGALLLRYKYKNTDDTNTKTKTTQIQRTYKYKYKRNTFQLKEELNFCSNTHSSDHPNSQNT